MLNSELLLLQLTKTQMTAEFKSRKQIIVHFKIEEFIFNEINANKDSQ